MGFVWFIAGFGDLSYEQKAEDPALVKQILKDAKAIVERKLFEYAPIDRQKIGALAPKEIHDLPALIQHLQSIKQGKLAKQFEPLVSLKIPEESAHKMGDPVDLAWAFYFNRLFRQIYPAKTPALHRTDKKEVRLAADYNGWVLVKKVRLSTESKEILAALVGMNQTLLEKVPEFCCQNFVEYQAKVEKILPTFPKRKSFARLPEILKALESPELGTEDEELREYALTKALEHAGFQPYISAELFSSFYPELKISKPRGNFRGKKKK